MIRERRYDDLDIGYEVMKDIPLDHVPCGKHAPILQGKLSYIFHHLSMKEVIGIYPHDRHLIGLYFLISALAEIIESFNTIGSEIEIFCDLPEAKATKKEDPEIIEALIQEALKREFLKNPDSLLNPGSRSEFDRKLFLRNAKDVFDIKPAMDNELCFHFLKCHNLSLMNSLITPGSFGSFNPANFKIGSNS